MCKIFFGVSFLFFFFRLDVRWNQEACPPAESAVVVRRAPQVANSAEKFVIPVEAPQSNLSCSVEVDTSLFPELAAASHSTSALIRLHLTRPLFVFLHRVIYQPVMRSKTLSGYSDNQPSFRVAEKYALSATGFCCATRFRLLKFVTGSGVGADVKTQQHMWLFFLYERKRK